ncbi:MAG: histidine kinase dimerization/phospho-acceptor domain-containing protein [bacterium]|nr:histidine kinase dimerization/phospho-acceptor domain-containing protein [bacterium]
MRDLAAALNDMAARLDDKLRTLMLRRNEQEAILISLREGVVAVDHREHILFMNNAATKLLGVDGERVVGRMLTEVIRASELQRFVTGMMQRADAVRETEVRAGSLGDRTLQVTGTDLRDTQGRRIGLLIVLNDVTRIRRLETVRREFVANVSHELKTPVTSIQGYVETLREGAADDPKTRRAFLDRLARNADRLNAIIEDLLALSRLEQENPVCGSSGRRSSRGRWRKRRSQAVALAWRRSTSPRS